MDREHQPATSNIQKGYLTMEHDIFVIKCLLGIIFMMITYIVIDRKFINPTGQADGSRIEPRHRKDESGPKGRFIFNVFLKKDERTSMTIDIDEMTDDQLALLLIAFQHLSHMPKDMIEFFIEEIEKREAEEKAKQEPPCHNN